MGELRCAKSWTFNGYQLQQVTCHYCLAPSHLTANGSTVTNFVHTITWLQISMDDISVVKIDHSCEEQRESSSSWVQLCYGIVWCYNNGASEQVIVNNWQYSKLSLYFLIIELSMKNRRMEAWYLDTERRLTLQSVSHTIIGGTKGNVA